MLCLPNELIALVLMHLSEGPEVDGSSWPLRGTSHAWLPLAQTCRRVHDVAVFTQCLWRRIAVFSQTGGLNVAFGRSGDLEIDVIFHRPRIIPSAFMLLAPHAARVRRLVIVEADHDTRLALRFLLARPMPALTTCQVQLIDWGVLVPCDPDLRVFTADLALIPNLRALQLGVATFDWESATVPHLRKLSLWHCPSLALSTFDRFLEILQSCTSLEHLEIRSSGPFTALVHPGRRLARVALPNLRTLNFDSYLYDRVYTLLPHLQLSEHVSLNLYLCIYTDEYEDSEEPTIALPNIIPADPARLPLLTSATSAFLRFGSTLWVKFSAPERGPGQVDLLVFPSDETDWQFTPSQAVAHFCAVLADAPLRALELSLQWPYAGEARPKRGTLTHVSRAFPALEELVYDARANKASDRQLLDALLRLGWPRLRVLRLEQWSGKLVPSLVRVLQARAARGLRLSQLDIHLVSEGRDVSETVLQELYGLVDGNVEVR